MTRKKQITHAPGPDDLWPSDETSLPTTQMGHEEFWLSVDAQGRSPTTARAINAVHSAERAYAPQEAKDLWARAAKGDFDADDVLPFLQAVAQAIIKATDAGKPMPAEVGLYRYNARRTWADDVATEVVRNWQEFPLEEVGDALPSLEAILEHLMADPRAGQLPERTRDKELRTIAERAREKARKQGSK